MLESELKKLSNQIEQTNVHLANLIAILSTDALRKTTQETAQPAGEFREIYQAVDPMGTREEKEEAPVEQPLPSNVSMLPPTSEQQQAPPVTMSQPMPEATQGFPFATQDSLTEMQAYASKRMAEISAQLGRPDVMQGLMAHMGITDISKANDDALKSFINAAEHTLKESLGV